MVQLAPYLVADSIASYCTDYIDGESIEAIFAPSELAELLAFRQFIPPDLMGLLRDWTLGFCPLNHIERSLSDLIDARQAHPVRRTTAAVTVPASSWDSTMRNSAPGSAGTHARRENSGNCPPRPSSRDIVLSARSGQERGGGYRL